MYGSPRLVGLTTFLVSLSLFQAACTCGSGPYEGDYFEEDRPEALSKVNYKESEKGDPKVVGCADGQREGFADLKKFPEIAGCVATWEGPKSLRDKGNGTACGDDGDTCSAPAAACAPGWHVCGDKGRTKDLTDRVKVDECHNAGPGRFNAALSHGQTDELCPPKPTARTVFPCTDGGIGAEPVCCGNDCLYGKCRDGVWPGKTKISRGKTEGCGKVTAARNGGVLCCADEGTVAAAAQEGAPEAKDGATGGGETEGAEGAAGDAKADDAKAADAKAGDAKAADAKAADGKKAAAKAADAKKADGKAG